MSQRLTDHERAEAAYGEFCRSGSPRAMAEVFDRTAPELLLVARRFTRDAASAEDLVQQTFLRAIERAGQFESGRRLLPWLTAILANEARMEARRRREPESVRVRGDSVEPSREAERREASAAMEKALGELPATYRDVVALRLLHGVKPQQIAAALAVPVGTVKTRLHRGVRKLAASLPQGLALGTAVSLCAGHGLAAGRRAIWTHAAQAGAASSWMGSIVWGLLAMKKIIVPVAIAAALWITLALLSRGDAPPPGSGSSSPAPADVSAAMRGAADDDRPQRTAAPTTGGVASVEEPNADGPVESSITVRATWSRSKEPAVDVPLTLLVQPSRRIANLRTDGAGEGQFDVAFAAYLWQRGVPRRYRQASVVCAFAPGRYHNFDAAPGSRVVEIEIDEGTRAAGIVVDAAGAPVGGAVVWLGIGHAPAFAAATTGTDGRFALHAVPDRFSLRATAGLASSTVLSRSDLDDGQTAFVLRLDQPASRLTVRVVDVSGAPMADATLRLDRGWQYPRHVRISDDQGIALWPGCPPGSYELEVVHRDAAPAQHRIEIAGAGQDLSETVVLGPSASLAGVVRGGDGAVVALARIVFNDAASLLQVRANSDKNGRFAVDGLAVGTYGVWVRDSGAEMRKRVTLHEGAQEIELVMPGTSRIVGRLMLPSGDPAAGWTVQARRVDEFGQAVARRTDEAGRFAFDGLPERAFRLDVRGSDGDGGHTFFAVATHGEDLVYRLPGAAIWQAATVVGQILDAPVDASLWVAPRGKSARTGHQLGDEGRFEWGSLRPGHYHLGLTAAGLRWWFAEVELSSGQRLDVGAHRMPAPGRLRVVIDDEFGHDDLGVSVAPVGFEGRSGASRQRALSRTTWEVDGLTPGDHLVRVHGERVAAAPKTVTVEAGVTAEVSIVTLPAERVTLRLVPPAGTSWWQIGVRKETVRDSAGAVVRRWEGIGTLERELWLAAGWHAIDVETVGGFAGRTEFTVPMSEGEVVVVPLAR